MNCKKTKSMIDAYVDDGLGAAQSAALEAHVSECPSCAKALAEARELGAALRSSDSQVPSTLHGAVHRKMANPLPVPVASWKNTMRTIAKTRWGLTAVAASLLVAGALILTPRAALAGNAKATWKKMQAAAAKVDNVHIQNYWSENGRTGRSEIWADDRRVRFQTPKAVTIFNDGQCQTYQAEEIFEKVEDRGADAIGIVSPKDFDVFEQIKRLQVYGGQIVGLPDQVVKGSTVKVVGFENEPRGTRFTFLVEPKSGLPLRKVDEVKKDGKWQEVSHQDFEFNVKLSDSLFQAPKTKPQ